MKTQEFLKLLENNPNKELVFEFQENEFVPKSFHITEIKSKQIQSVDCGGFQHNYDETVVQLWIPEKEKKEIGMDAAKALKIFKIVDGKNPLKKETPIYFEFGHGELRTSIYDIQAAELSDNQIIIKMFVPATACKPLLTLATTFSNESSGCCGPNSSCC